MTASKWLTVIGALFLLAGLAIAFLSSRYAARVMGEARKGVAVLAPEKGSPEWEEKNRLTARADFWFYVGLVLTGIGVVLQTLGAFLPQL